MSTYTITASTSVILVDTSILTAGASAIVLLSSQSPPGRNVTVRDSLGYLSSPQSIIVSTTNGVSFADGTSSIKISQRFATLSFSSRDASTWNIINTFGFPLYDTVANVNSLTASTLNGDTLIAKNSISTSQLIGNSLYLTSTAQVSGNTFISRLVVGSRDSTLFNNIPGYSAYLMGSMYIGSNVSIGGNLTVDGVTRIQSSITTSGSLTVGAGITTGGNIIATGDFQTIGGGLFTCATATVGSTMTVLGSAIFNSNVTITSNLTIGGITTAPILATSTLQINALAGGFLNFDNGPTLTGRTDIVPGQVVASWNSPIYTPFLSTNTINTTGISRVDTLQVSNTISANTVTQFIMSSTSIQNSGGNLSISSITTNSLTLSNVFMTRAVETSSLLVSSLIAQTQIQCISPLGYISAASLYTSSLMTSSISTGIIIVDSLQTPSVSVSSLRVAQTIIGGPAFTTLSIPSTVVQNAGGSLQTRLLNTSSLNTSSLTITSGLIQGNSNISFLSPVVMDSLFTSTLTTSTLRVSSIQTTQITIGAITNTVGPTLVQTLGSNITVSGGPGDYITPYFLSNVKPLGQNPNISYSTLANYTAAYSGPLPPGLQIGYTATLFWAGQSQSYLTIENGNTLYGSYGSDQSVTGTIPLSSFKLQGILYGNSAINVTFGFQYSSNVNSIDSNAVLDFNNGILRWNYALNGTTIQNSLNDMSTRNLYYYGGLQFASDPRLKEDIQDADLRLCYDTINSLPLRRYKYIDSYCSTFQVRDTHRLGFLATDLLPHFPKSVKSSDTIFPQLSTSLLTIDTSQIEMAHLGATKYLMEEVSRLEKLLDALNLP
jgi:hypothetical protein